MHRDENTRLKYMNSPAYIGVFYHPDEVERIISPGLYYSDYFKYVLWELVDYKNIVGRKKFRWNMQAAKEPDYTLMLSYSSYSSYVQVQTHHVRIRIHSLTGRYIVDSLCDTIGRYWELGFIPGIICPYATYSICQYNSISKKKEQNLMEPDRTYFRSNSRISKNMLLPNNKYGKQPWSLYKLSAFFIETFFTFNQDIPYRILPRILYNSIFIEQYHLHSECSNGREGVTNNIEEYFDFEDDLFTDLNLKCLPNLPSDKDYSYDF
jgi:hypothetical protein